MSSSAAATQRTDRGQNGEPSGLNWLEQAACSIVKVGAVPQHVAFIMDGNRRFARTRGIEVARGHQLGYDKLEQVRTTACLRLLLPCQAPQPPPDRRLPLSLSHSLVCARSRQVLRWCCELGVHGVTVYAFSLENFKRSKQEVDALMALAEEGLREMCDEDHLVQRRGVRVRVVGELSRVSDSLRGEMQRVMRMTQGNTRHTLTVCFAYTSRNEIAGAVRRLAKACGEGRLEPSDVTPSLLEGCLYTSAPGVPPVDLIVRTSGEKRLSDFLLWQAATCPVVFTKVMWPELSLLRFLGLLFQFQRNAAYFEELRGAARSCEELRHETGAAAEEAAPGAPSAPAPPLATDGVAGSELGSSVKGAARSVPAPASASPAARRLLLGMERLSTLFVGVLGVLSLLSLVVAVAARASGGAAAASAASTAAAALIASWALAAVLCPIVRTPEQPGVERSPRRLQPQRVRDFVAELNVDRWR